VYRAKRRLCWEINRIFSKIFVFFLEAKYLSDHPRTFLQNRVVPIPSDCDLCSMFLQMTEYHRSASIQRKQLCYKCFASNNHFHDWASAHNCFTCQRRHPTLLGRPVSAHSHGLTTHTSDACKLSNQWNDSTYGIYKQLFSDIAFEFA